jgi:hypothetical protein
MVDGPAGGVMVVTKFFAAQAWTAATSTVSEDMTALKAFGCVCHLDVPPVVQKVAKY